MQRTPALPMLRNLSAKIKAKADALVSKAEVSGTVSAETLATEKAEVSSTGQATRLAFGKIHLDVFF
ncbi:MAG: hypothetical protein ACREPY_09070 [Rhodanobacteraceae bacterium]